MMVTFQVETPVSYTHIFRSFIPFCSPPLMLNFIIIIIIVSYHFYSIRWIARATHIVLYVIIINIGTFNTTFVCVCVYVSTKHQIGCLYMWITFEMALEHVVFKNQIVFIPLCKQSHLVIERCRQKSEYFLLVLLYIIGILTTIMIINI